MPVSYNTSFKTSIDSLLNSHSNLAPAQLKSIE